MNLFVSYGGYKKESDIKKEIFIKQDSVFVWYSLFQKVKTVPTKSYGITKPNSSPRITYISVDSLEIYKSPRKTIFLHYIFY